MQVENLASIDTNSNRVVHILQKIRFKFFPGQKIENPDTDLLNRKPLWQNGTPQGFPTLYWNFTRQCDKKILINIEKE